MIPRLVSPTARMRPWLLRASGCWTCREIDLLLARLTVREVMTTSVLVVDPDRSGSRGGPDHDGRQDRRARLMNSTILMVEDEPDLAATCRRLLSRKGWRVVTVSTRDGGLTALAGIPRPALAIVDLRLPDGDGFDVLRAARAAGTPVIMVTGYGSPGVRQSALEEGAAALLVKPFPVRDLADLVHTIAGDPVGPLAALGNSPGA
jgi:CheY-like chemotaxis protein